MERIKETATLYALFAALISSLGGFLFGYHTAIVSGALSLLSLQFSLTLWDQSFLVSSVLLGALGGASIAGILADHLGRKKTLVVASTLLLLGGGCAVLAPSYFFLLMSRFVCGFSMGIFSIVSPVYLAEISPQHARGSFVSSYQLAIGFGGILAYFVNSIYMDLGLWREMFAIGLIPVFLQLVGLCFLSESPSYLISQGKKELATAVFTKLRKDTLWETQIQDEKSVEKNSTKFSALFADSKLRSLLLLGFLVSIFQQLIGVNAIALFVPKILEIAGHQYSGAGVWVTIGLGIVSVMGTLLASAVMDRLGRRILMLISTFGCVLSLILLGFAAQLPPETSFSILAGAILGFMGFFSIGLGPVTWVIISEIFPLSIRGKAVGIAVFANWIFTYLVAFSFLHLVDWCGLTYSFYLYAALGSAIFVFFKRSLPETKSIALN